MISVCTCSIAAYQEALLFLRALKFHNPDTDYEVCLVVDTRTDEDYRAKLEFLSKQEDLNLKTRAFTKDDSILYLEKLIAFYEKSNLFWPNFIETIKSNLLKYKTGTLFPNSSYYLWISSGVLYNLAVELSSSDLYIISPSDYVYLYPLSDVSILEEKNKSPSGFFYKKPCAAWAFFSNLPKEELQSKLEQRRQTGTTTIGRYHSFGKSLSDFYIYDDITDSLIYLDDPLFLEKMSVLTKRLSAGYGDKSLLNMKSRVWKAYHGQHFINKKTFQEIGGFTEEWYGRAWADDKMTHLGRSLLREDSKLSYNLLSPVTMSFLMTREFSSSSDKIITQYSSYYLESGFNSKVLNGKGINSVLDKEFSVGSTTGRDVFPRHFFTRR